MDVPVPVVFFDPFDFFARALASAFRFAAKADALDDFFLLALTPALPTGLAPGLRLAETG